MEGRSHILVFDRGDEGWAFILTGESEQEVGRRMKECAVRLGELVHTYRDIQYFGSIGSCVNHGWGTSSSPTSRPARHLPAAFSEMNQVVDYNQMEQMFSATGNPLTSIRWTAPK